MKKVLALLLSIVFVAAVATVPAAAKILHQCHACDGGGDRCEKAQGQKGRLSVRLVERKNLSRKNERQSKEKDRRAGGAGDWLEEDMIDDKKIKNNSDYRLLSNHYRV